MISLAWARLKDEIEKLLADLDNFKIIDTSKSPLFEYWNKFINCIAPILHDLTGSFLKGDWNLHLTWGIPLDFH